MSACRSAIASIYASCKENYQEWSQRLQFDRDRDPSPVVLMVTSDATRAGWLFEHLTKHYELLRNPETDDRRRWVTIQVDSKVFDADRGNEGVLREMVSTVGRSSGDQMEPRIHDGDFCVFRAHPTGTRQGKIVLAQYRGPADPETGGSFTVKRYSSEKVSDSQGAWRHSLVTLSPLNPDFKPIRLTPESDEDVQIVAEFLAVLGQR